MNNLLEPIIQYLSDISLSSNLSLWELLIATGETFLMVLTPGLVAFALGLPLGVLLYVTRRGNLMENISLNYVLSVIVNATRSVPFIILMIALIPLTKALVGSSIGNAAAMVPLTIAAIPFLARLIETSLNEVPNGLVEALQSMGASKFQIMKKALVSEALPGIISGLTLTLVNLVGYSAIAGAIGAGGLGALAYNDGYNRDDVVVMIYTVVFMIIIVQGIQSLGDYVVHKVISH